MGVQEETSCIKKKKGGKVQDSPSNKGVCMTKSDWLWWDFLSNRKTHFYQIVLALVISHDMHLEHMDLKNTFLYGFSFSLSFGMHVN